MTVNNQQQLFKWTYVNAFQGLCDVVNKFQLHPVKNKMLVKRFLSSLFFVGFRDI